jgi:hypothetical protein
MSLYRALNEDEVNKARFNLLKEGEYDAVVTQAFQKISANSGNNMAELYLSIKDEYNEEHIIKDYLVFTRKMLWKVKHFCDSSGLQQEYLDEKFTPEMASSKKVRVKVRVKIGDEIPLISLSGKPIGSKYPDKNEIEDYILQPSFNSMKPLPEVKNDFIDSDLPF